MAKLKLVAAPTFSHPVKIPMAGGAPVPVTMEFKHRTKKELDEFIKSRAEKTDTETVLEMVSSWELEDEYNKENVELLLENYIGAALAVYTTYIDQLVQAKLGN